MSQSQFNWTDRLQVGVILLKEHEEALQPLAGPTMGQAQITAIRTAAGDKQAPQRYAALEHAFGAAVLVDKDQKSLIKHTVSSALQGSQSTILVHGPACAAKVHFMLGADGLLAQVVREIELCGPDRVTVLALSAPSAAAASTAMDCDVSQLIHVMHMSYAQRTEAVLVIRFVVSIAGKVTGIAVVDLADPSPSTPSTSSTSSSASSSSSFRACSMDCGSKDAGYRALGDALFALSEGIPDSTLLPQMLAEHLTSSAHTVIFVCIPADSEAHADALVVADVCCKLKSGSVLLAKQPELMDAVDCQRILTKAQQQVPELPMNEETVQLQSPLVYHAIGCVGCASAVCAAIKSSLAHAERCRLTMQGGCKVCKHVSNLLSAHARRCQLDRCKVPHCNATRKHWSNKPAVVPSKPVKDTASVLAAHFKRKHHLIGSAPTERAKRTAPAMDSSSIAHASICTGCGSEECSILRQYIAHDAYCTVRVKGRCSVCLKMVPVYASHAKLCKVEDCKVPRCTARRA